MTPNGRLRLVLEFDPDADPVSGVLIRGDGGTEVFAGWMALTRAIEAALGAGSHHRPDGLPTGVPTGRRP
jgi:hypothetical protein